MTLRRWIIPGASAILVVAAPASAQVGEDLLAQSPIPQSYDRGHNVGVVELPRPEYAPLGERLGSLLFNPRVEVAAGGTSNTYYDTSHPIASPFLSVSPSAQLQTDWARHYLLVAGGATFRDYIGQSRRNEEQWNLSALGRLDVRSTLTVQAQAQAQRLVENIFSGEVAAAIAALSHYQREFASLQSTYTSGRGRAFLLADYTNYRFSPIPLSGGGSIDQSDRNRHIVRLTGQMEYAYTSSLSVFAQLSGSQTGYTRNLLEGGPNLDSKAVRFLAGTNVDIAGRVRGSLGIGYSIRNYDASIYRTIRGVSVESHIELFPLRRLTVTLTGERTIEDASLSRQSYWNTQFGLHGDYELLHNLILNAEADFSHQSYLGTMTSGNSYGAVVGGRYLGSRRVSLTGSVSYSYRTSNSALAMGSVDEARAQVGVAYQL